MVVILSLSTLHSSFSHRALRRHGCGFQIFSCLCSFMSVDTPLSGSAQGLPVPRTQHSAPLWSEWFRKQGPSHRWQGTFLLSQLPIALDFLTLTSSSLAHIGFAFSDFSRFSQIGPGFSNNPLGLEILQPQLPELAEYLLFFTVMFLHDFHLKSKALLALTQGSSGTPLQYSCLENPMDRAAW